MNETETKVCMADTKTVKEIMKSLEEAGCKCRLDLDGGTAAATDDGAVVYLALQKSENGAWIVRLQETESIKFLD